MSHERFTRDNGYGFTRPDRLAASLSLWTVFIPMHFGQGALLGVIHDIAETQTTNELLTMARFSWLAMVALNAVAEWQALENRKIAVGPWGPIGAEILHGHTGVAATVSSVHRGVETLLANPISVASLVLGGDRSLFFSIITANIVFSSTALVNLAISTGKADLLINLSGKVVKGFEYLLDKLDNVDQVPVWPDMTMEQREFVRYRQAASNVSIGCPGSSSDKKNYIR